MLQLTLNVILSSHTAPSLLPSVSRWRRCTRWSQTSRAEALASELHLLKLNNTPLQQKQLQVGPGKQDFIHYLNGGLTTTSSPPLVAIPGYSSGAGFMFRVLKGLTAGFNLFSVDLLGTGLSGRPSFKATNTKEAEDFFVESLEEWRKQAGVHKILLLAHSLGGYLATVYALRYPDNVAHLVLVSPAGVGGRPPEWQPPEQLRNPWTVRGQFFRFAMRAWDWNWTPGVFVRGMGPWGRGWIERYCRNRFKQGHHMSEDEVSRFENYVYHVTAQPGSGEFALRHLLAPLAWAKVPLEDRLLDLKVPVTFIYGEEDWMQPEPAQRALDKLKKIRQGKGEGEGGKLVASDLSIVKTPSSGHWPFIDQPSVFLQQVAEACGPHISKEEKQAVVDVANALPFFTGPAEDTAEEMEADMVEHPIKTEQKIASDM